MQMRSFILILFYSILTIWTYWSINLLRLVQKLLLGIVLVIPISKQILVIGYVQLSDFFRSLLLCQDYNEQMVGYRL